jgi:hypothetical protein
MLIYYMFTFAFYFIHLFNVNYHGIDHGFVHVYLYSNKDRSLLCLRHPFGNVIFPFINSRLVSVCWQIAFYSYMSSHLAS